jgi:hypothetical protein
MNLFINIYVYSFKIKFKLRNLNNFLQIIDNKLSYLINEKIAKLKIIFINY